jgi:hypothetical protein
VESAGDQNPSLIGTGVGECQAEAGVFSGVARAPSVRVVVRCSTFL